MYVHFQGKPFNNTIIHVYAPNTIAKEAEAEDLQEDLLWRPTRLSGNNTKKDILFIIGDWNAKAGNQDIPRGPGKFGFGLLNEAGQRLTEYYQENALVIANTLFQQHNRWLYIWTSPDGQYRNQIDYIFCSQKWRSSIQPVKTRLGAVTQIMDSLLSHLDLHWRK